jgi:hypothetical protein
MGDYVETVHLGLQLAVTAGFGLLMTIIHTVGLVGISRFLKLEERSLHPHKLDSKMLLVIGSIGFMVAALHILEIVVFATFYLAVGAMATFEDALYHSATAYSTLGMSDGSFPRNWRLVGAFEGLTGFVLIGWSTAYMVSTMGRIRS